MQVRVVIDFWVANEMWAAAAATAAHEAITEVTRAQPAPDPTPALVGGIVRELLVIGPALIGG